jgi:phosphoenolpyruvate-protein kinase (PTS system EI component)
MKKFIAKGFGGIDKVVSGELIEWRDKFFDYPDSVKDKIIYNKGNMPLYRAAFLVDTGVKAVLMEEGGTNYHPLILIKHAEVVTVAGIGDVDFESKIITVDGGKGIIYEGEMPIKKREERKRRILDTRTKVYASLDPAAFGLAVEAGADGIGLLRTEYIASRTILKILNKELYDGLTVKEAIKNSNEADVIYAISKNKDLRDYLKLDLKNTIKNAMDCFAEKEIIIRTIDIAREATESMGNRGIRRCIAEGGETIKILAEAIKESIEEKKGNYNIGVILPLVSHYSQIKTALEIILSTGLRLKQNGIQDRLGIQFGWEIEQPAATENNEIWLIAFKAEYGQYPHYIAIGTVDLTQFTIALGRDTYSKEKNLDVQNYLNKLSNESDLSVVKQIYEVSKHCKQAGTKLFILGQVVTNPNYLRLMLSFGLIPSVGASSIKKVKFIVSKFEKQGNSKEIIRKYIEIICDQYIIQARRNIRYKLIEIFDLE